MSIVEAVAVKSATAGLHLAAEACGIGPGDSVIVPTLTFTATAEAVRYLGAEVVLVDVEPETHLIDLDDAAPRLTPNCTALMPVHFGGLPCDMDPIRCFARRNGLRVIEDAAHALPAHSETDTTEDLKKFAVPTLILRGDDRLGYAFVDATLKVYTPHGP